ncbi:MAG: hypothetical protein KBC38_02300 [Candidatus Pacebacteria bacterium]|nr:hypothetical protein [Candidatus Paceibacterota bacterium]MBP9840644.1 hypothetical protein [Candidatus Paceibacterota bacterium]
MFNLTKSEERALRKLNTPIKVQDFLDAIPLNFEPGGDTHLSPRRVLRENRAHCIEGALVAATAFWMHGRPPLLMDLRAKRGDFDHVIALYKENGHWGAVSKTNHATIRFRDPVYPSLKALALSYFHEWFLNTTGRKTLLSFSKPFDLSRLGDGWITSEEDLFWLDEKLDTLPHTALVPTGNARFIRRADPMELSAGRLIEWEKTPRGARRARTGRAKI